jgi:hypothetical protein
MSLKITLPAFAGVRCFVAPPESDSIEEQEAEDDLEGEKDLIFPTTCQDASGEDKNISSSSKPTPSFAKLQDTVLQASKGVTEGTDNEYMR